MKRIQLLQMNKVDEEVVRHLAVHLPESFNAPCDVLGAQLDPSPAFHSGRQQYHSTEILARAQKLIAPDTWRILLVTSFDLYIPILTFVFGEAQMEGKCAIVSTCRLTQEFYGLPPDPALLRQRALKEAVHELGHTIALSHCEDYRCAMAPSHAVEWIDLKETGLCSCCRDRAGIHLQRSLK